MNRIFLYGIAGADDNYRVVRYVYIDAENEPIAIRSIRNDSSYLKFKNPGIEEVYAIDGDKQLCYIYRETIKKNSISCNTEFKCMLEKMGIKII